MAPPPHVSQTSLRCLTLQPFWHNASVIIHQTRIPVRTKACGGPIESDENEFGRVKRGSLAKEDSPLLPAWYSTGDFPNEDDWQV